MDAEGLFIEHRTPDIIDPNPNGKECVGARPWRGSRLTRDVAQKRIHLVRECLYGGRTWWHERGIDGGAAVGEVVGKHEGVVVFDRRFINPVCATDGGVALSAFSIP